MKRIIYDFETKTEMVFDAQRMAEKAAVPVYNIPMMTDERWNQLAREEAINNLAAAGIVSTEDNIKAYFTELRKLAECSTCGYKPEVGNPEMFPILSAVL